MTWSEYYKGVQFIKDVSSSIEEATHRLDWWRENALPLVGKVINIKQEA